MAAAAPRLIAVVGPTGAGKSGLGLRLAEELGGEIVSCDSLQVYRGFDIGSAKPDADERRRVPHHLLDVADPDEEFSAARYAELARAALRGIAERGHVSLVVGGTGLYLRALLHGLFRGPARDATLRARLDGLAARHGDARLHRLLARVDPEAAARIRPADRVRVVRALEVYRATRIPISAHQQAPGQPLAGFEVGVFVLSPPVSELRERVVARTQAMFERRLLRETAELLARHPEARGLRAIGYLQAVAVARGEADEAGARRDIVTASMRFAKRQRTWFRHQTPEAVWFSDVEGAHRGILDWMAGARRRQAP